jgi:hypothetical protein
MMSPPCQHEGEAIGVYGGGPTDRYTFENGAKKDYYNRRGGYQGTIAEKREAMGIDWMNASEINQAIPPAYTELIGHQLLRHLKSSGPQGRPHPWDVTLEHHRTDGRSRTSVQGPGIS